MAGYHAYGLPVELLDMIFEETDLETQKACSLVCHVWLDVSRKYLFDLIVVRNETSFDAFRQCLDEHPHIGIHIRIMHLEGPSEHHILNSWTEESQYPIIDPATLVSIALSTPNLSCILLQTVILDNTTDDAKAALLDMLPGPICLAEFSIKQCPSGLYHHPSAILDLFYLFQTKNMQIELSGGWAVNLHEQDAHHASSIVPRWPVHHQAVCMEGLYHRRPSPFSTLTALLAPGSLRILHLTFGQWSHLDEMARFLKCFGESITEFTIEFASALVWYIKDPAREPSDEDWVSYNFSSLRNLSKLRFDLNQPLLVHLPDVPRSRVDSIGIPRFLACFPKELPLDDGVYIDLRFVNFIGEKHYMNPCPEVDGALLRFENLKRVTLCDSWRGHDLGERHAMDIGARAFPRLWQAKKLVCVVGANETRCSCRQT